MMIKYRMLSLTKSTLSARSIKSSAGQRGGLSSPNSCSREYTQGWIWPSTTSARTTSTHIQTYHSILKFS